LDYDYRLEIHYDCEMHCGCQLLLLGKHSGYFLTRKDSDF